MTDHRPLADPRTIAEFLGTTTQQLAQDRYRGQGPKFIRVGRRVRYRWTDVEAWLDANTRISTGAA